MLGWNPPCPKLLILKLFIWLFGWGFFKQTDKEKRFSLEDEIWFYWLGNNLVLHTTLQSYWIDELRSYLLQVLREEKKEAKFCP